MDVPAVPRDAHWLAGGLHLQEGLLAYNHCGGQETVCAASYGVYSVSLDQEAKASYADYEGTTALILAAEMGHATETSVAEMVLLL